MIGQRLDSKPHELAQVLGTGAEMKAIYSLIREISAASHTILITGEKGLGKEKLSRAIHDQSKYRWKNFVPVRCGSYSESHLGKILFGKDGLFDQPDVGTLFLSEISDLTLPLQLRLTELLSASREIKSHWPRLIVASTKDLSKEVVRGCFREDLLCQLNIVEIKVPPLWARKQDIPPLIKYYAAHFSEEFGKKVRSVTDKAGIILMHHSWKGNVRELRNVLERAILLCDSDAHCLDVHDLLPDLSNFREAVRTYEYRHIQQALEKNQFDKRKTASELGLSLSSLYRKIEELSLPMQ